MTSDFPVWFVVGPTATGKTSVAHWLARRYGFEILSADSMLVYRGLDIGTAKPSAQERDGIRYHGLDLVGPDEMFSVGSFLEHARTACAECEARGGRMLVAGGTGLYVNALLKGLDTAAPPDAARHDHWTARLATEGPDALRGEAERLCPGVLERMADPRNPRRLIRVLERLEQGEDPLPKAPSPSATVPPLAALWLEPAALSLRIERRVADMFAAGLLDEVHRLTLRFPTWSPTARAAIGYAEALAVIAGTMTEPAAQALIATRTRQLAKRQRTWYRHQVPVAWIEGPADAADIERTGEAVAAHWRKHGAHTVFRSADRPPREGE